MRKKKYQNKNHFRNVYDGEMNECTFNFWDIYLNMEQTVAKLHSNATNAVCCVILLVTAFMRKKVLFDAVAATGNYF